MIGAASRRTRTLRSPCSTSISVSSLADRSSASSRTRSVSTCIARSVSPFGLAILRALFLFSGGRRGAPYANAGCRVQCEQISMPPQAMDSAARNGCNQALPAELLAGIGIGQMDLDDRWFDRRHGVAQRHRCRGEPGGVENHGASLALMGFVQPVDQLALMVGLASF